MRYPHEIQKSVSDYTNQILKQLEEKLPMKKTPWWKGLNDIMATEIEVKIEIREIDKEGYLFEHKSPNALEIYGSYNTGEDHLHFQLRIYPYEKGGEINYSVGENPNVLRCWPGDDYENQSLPAEIELKKGE